MKQFIHFIPTETTYRTATAVQYIRAIVCADNTVGLVNSEYIVRTTKTVTFATIRLDTDYTVQRLESFCPYR